MSKASTFLNAFVFLCWREFRGGLIFDVCWNKKVYKSVALIKKVTKKIKKFPRQSASLTRRQRLKSVQGFHFSLRLCLPLLAKISGGVLFFQGYFISNFAVMKIALVEMKIGKAYSLPLVRLSVRKRRGKGGKHTRAEIIWVVFP